MTTQRDGQRLKEAYRLALSEGSVARYREHFRSGRIVQFGIEEDTGFSDGLSADLRFELVGHFQLRYFPGSQPLAYGVFGRLAESKLDEDWLPVDGPWKCGAGPFDRR